MPQAVRAEQKLRGLRRYDAAVGAGVGAHVHREPPAQGEQRAVARERDRQLALHLARVVRGHQVLAPVLDPLHRAPERERRERDQQVLRIELAARPEAAADVDLDHRDRIDRALEHRRERAPVPERHLRCAPDLELAVALEADEAARLHRHRAVALAAEGLGAHVVGARECRVDVAEADVVSARAVGPRFGEEHRAVRARGRDVYHRGQRLVVHRDQLRRVLGDVAVARHDQRDRFAHVAHAVLRERTLQIAFGALERPGPDRDRRGVRGDIGKGVHGGNAWHGTRRGRFDAPQQRVGMRAAHDHRVQHARELQVVDVAPASSDEAQVLAARDRTPDPPCRSRAGLHSRPALAAASTAATMPMYPVHLQMLPESAARTSSGVGSGFSARSAVAVTRKPAVQNPHWSAWCS